MKSQSLVLRVSGMSCHSCEMKITEALSQYPGITMVKANKNRKMVSLTYIPQSISLEQIKAIIEGLGYIVEGVLAEPQEKKTVFFMLLFIGTIGILFVLFLFQQKIGVHFLPVITPEMGYGMLFLVGILTSLHCVGMCGGINLSQTLQKSSSIKKSGMSSLKYNMGRLISYTIIGGAIGGIGKVFAFSPFSKGLLFILAGVMMIFLGMNIFGLFSLRGFFRIFQHLYKVRVQKEKTMGPFVVGILNGFMPCGPLYGMQLYALSTGSVTQGALSMFFFALGTFPLMFGLGALAAFLSHKFTEKMMKISGVVVIFLGLSLFSNGLTLSGKPLLTTIGQDVRWATVNNNEQTVVTEIKPNRYTPIIVEKGKPVRWIVRVKEEDLNSCNNSIVIPAYGIEKKLVPGDNIIEFTPEKEGVFSYSCWMGMISSTIKVVSNIGEVNTLKDAPPETLSDGRGCCSSNQTKGFFSGDRGSEFVGLAEIRNDIQEVVVTVDEYGYSPTVIVLQKGVQAKIRFNPKRLTSCNYLVLFPEYGGRLNLAAGQLETPLLTISGDFTFRCWMGMINGYAKVVEDLTKVDIEGIKKQIENHGKNNY